MLFIVFSALIGFSASFISGLFGGGAGLITVPGIYWLLALCYPHANHLMQISITTGTVIAMPLGCAASWRQWRHHNIDRPLFKHTVVCMIIGGLLGALCVSHVHSVAVKLFFAVMILLSAIWVWFHRPKVGEAPLPNGLHQVVGCVLGALSTGLGVSVFTVPFMVRSGLEIRRAIGTSTVLVWIYSGLAGLLLVGLGMRHGPLVAASIGYLNVPIVLAAIVPSILGSVLAVRFVNIWPQMILKRLFIAMMVLVALLMLF